MITSLEQRTDGYFYTSVINSKGECEGEWFYDTYLEAFKKWERLSECIRLELLFDVSTF